jgi:hypothetical protein
MENREFIDKDNFWIDLQVQTPISIAIERNTITKQEIVKPLFDEFKEKLSKLMYHNSESVCGDSMIDIDYLKGHIDEILYEMGIIGEVENDSN